MSRYGFNVDDVEIVVGWDNPTQTFFGQTEVNGKEVINTMLNMGRFDVLDVTLLGNMIGFDIPFDIQDDLILDRDNATVPTPLQEMMGKICRGDKR